jgi:diacylglycerol O-acyltransferase
VPQSGDIGMGVSIFSYAGHVQFGLITDAALTPDPEAVVSRFPEEFEKYLYYVLLDRSAPEEGKERVASPSPSKARKRTRTRREAV